jgi:tetratricopeptide (TPR) repeat protein
MILAAVAASLLLGQAQKNWKDTAEFELYSQISKATAPDQQLQLLNQWKEKYPDSEFKLERAKIYIVAYNRKNDPAGLYAAAKELLAIDPKALEGLYFINLLTVSMNKNDAESLELAVKAAHGLLSILDSAFDPSKRAAGMTEEQFKQQRLDTEVLAIKTLGWVEWQRKNYKESEKHFVKALEIAPGNAEMSYFLGMVIALQKDPKRQAEALWHFARAGYLDGPGALDPTRKAQVASYFNRSYTTYAGDDKKEMAEIIEKAKANVFPPTGFDIESKDVRMAKNAEKFKAENPMLYQFMEIRKALQAADGEAYWSNLKDAELPAFKGKLVSAKPEVNPKELVLAVETADQPEVTLVLEKPLRGKAEPGTEIEFTGVAKEYTKEPYSLKLEVENGKLKGWPAQAAPAKAAKPAVKKAAPAAKKSAKK